MLHCWRGPKSSRLGTSDRNPGVIAIRGLQRQSAWKSGREFAYLRNCTL